MDFIINKFNNRIKRYRRKKNTVIFQSILRQRTDYLLTLSIAYLLEKNKNEIDFDSHSKFIYDSSKLSTGHYIKYLREFDLLKEIFVNKKVKETLNNFPNIRNNRYAHGFTMTESEPNKFNDYMIDLYEILINEIEFLKSEYFYYYVEGKEQDEYFGYRIGPDGEFDEWSITPKSFFGSKLKLYNTYISTPSKPNFYIKVSPFIQLQDEETALLFLNLEEKLTGRIKYSKILSEDESYLEWEEIKDLFYSPDQERKLSLNGLIMNKFENNYTEYFNLDDNLEKSINDFLIKNTSSVALTLWGHGGVGKTALVQSTCNKLFNDPKKFFDYVVFISAKDRKFNYMSGEIEPLENNIRSLNEVLYKISQVLFEPMLEYDYFLQKIDEFKDKIFSISQKVLLVIDDFETFDVSEREQIIEFVKKLDINHHKVIFTSRIKHGLTGEQLTSVELDKSASADFLTKVFKSEFNWNVERIAELVSDSSKIELIHKATEGRPLFLYQFAYMYKSYNFVDYHFKMLATNENAKKFLYERLYDYLSNEAKLIFKYSYPIIIKESLSINISVLRYLLNELQCQFNVDDALDELNNLRITTKDSTDLHRIYSEDILKIMGDYYNGNDIAIKETIISIIEQIGWKNNTTNIYIDLLDKLNRDRDYKSEQENIDAYRKLLNDNNCSVEIKIKAFSSITGYLKNMNSRKYAINLYKEFSYFTFSHVDLVRMFALMLKEEREVEEACKVLKKYLKSLDKHNKNINDEILIFSILITYEGIRLLSDRKIKIKNAHDDKEIISEIRQKFKQKIAKFISDYQKKLVRIISENTASQIISGKNKELIKSNLTSAINAIVKLGTELNNISINDSNLINRDNTIILIKFGLNNLPNHIHETLISCKNNLLATNNNYIIEKGEKISLRITGINKKYGVFGKINDFVGLIHISNFHEEQVNNLDLIFLKGNYVEALIEHVNKKSKKLRLSLIN
ncbi:NB-ARC domain-containing protein [Falsibacillus pallidus]|uniref:NB-ARC domain-containing protein n=1 Tax=Falsibacillus pallidus TaxID=493781 RepID=UPI003D97AF71